MTYVGIAVMLLSLFLIPLGLPGLWIMVGVVALGAVYKMIGLLMLLLVLAVAGVAELLEFLLVKRLTDKYGGTRKAFWGAIGGGILGVIIGLPVPIIGSIIAAFIGSFVGAAVVTFAETKDALAARRVGWAALLGRAAAAAVKTFAGLVILVIGSFALLR